MKENNIEKLLEKFLEAETTLKEEKILADYFQNENIKPEWLIYKDMFGYFEESKNEIASKNFEPKTEKTKTLFNHLHKYAAVIMLALIGALFYYQQTLPLKNLGTYDNPKKAFEQTKEVFNLISYHLNAPSEDMKYLQTLEKTQNQYINKITP